MNKHTDEMREAFEHWARLSPPLLLDRDGDGEYECPQARWMWRTWEVAFKKGAFEGAAAMQKQCDIDYDTLAATDRYQDALEQVCGALENIFEPYPDYRKASNALKNAAPFRKKGVKTDE